MKRILLLAIAALWLAAPSSSQAQSLTKLCFPATGLTATRTSCIPVDSSNPLPTSATVSIGSSINVTPNNVVSAPLFVSTPNGFGGTSVTVNNSTVASAVSVTCTNCGAASVTGPFNVTVTNTAVMPVSEVNSSAILSAVQAAIPAGTNAIGTVTIQNFNASAPAIVSCTNCGASSISSVTIQNTTLSPVIAGAALQTAATPTVSTIQYTSGKCLGGFNQITVANVNGQTGVVTHFRVVGTSTVSTGALTPTMTVYLFDSQPGGTCTDTSTFLLLNTDLDKLIASPSSVSLTVPTGMTQSNASIDFTPPRPFAVGSSVKTIWYALVAGSTFTPANTTDFRVRAGAVLN